MQKKTWIALLAIVSVVSLFSFTIGQFKPEIPKVWDVEKLESMHMPYPDTAAKIIPLTEEYYYQIPERVSYKTYPFYMPGREPKGYYEYLSKQDPVINFKEEELKTEADWIKAGELIYNLPQNFFPLDSMLAMLPALGKAWEANGILADKNGVIPFVQIIVRKKGKPELGLFSCGMCHTKLMPDGTLMEGAQGNFTFDKFFWPLNRSEFERKKMPEAARQQFVEDFIMRLYNAPWIKHHSQENWKNKSMDERIAMLMDKVPGVMGRHSTALSYPVTVPDFYNMKERKYFDRTGHMQNRDIGDLMRYATLNQDIDRLNQYGGFFPRKPPVNAKDYPSGRLSDPQLYALAKFIYAIETPKNPQQFPASLLDRGKQIFTDEGCVGCHTPPLYSSNKLTPAEGFKPPAEHFKKYRIFDVTVGTDPTLTLYTRRGTGYYKIPSLIGAWNRTAFLHSGFVATLEDMFDDARLSPDYVPTGYKPYGVEKMAVQGHPFGLDLNADDKKALIAFIKSL